MKLPVLFPDKNIQASLLVALSAVLYGFLGFLGTHLLRSDMPIIEMQFWRFFIACLWMSGFAAKNMINKINYSTQGRFLLSMFLLGATAYAGSSGFFFLSCQTIGTGPAMVIFFSYPLIVAFVSWLIHGKKLRGQTLLIIAVMILGLYFLQDASDGSLSPLGIAAGLGSAVFYAFYVLGSKQFSTHSIDSSQMALVVCLGCAAIFLLVTLQLPGFVWPATLKSWVCILALGILATAIPIQLMLEGLKHISSMRASLISVLEPVVTVLVGVSLLDESLTQLQILGTCLILGAALVIQFQREL